MGWPFLLAAAGVGALFGRSKSGSGSGGGAQAQQATPALPPLNSAISTVYNNILKFQSTTSSKQYRYVPRHNPSTGQWEKSYPQGWSPDGKSYGYTWDFGGYYEVATDNETIVQRIPGTSEEEKQREWLATMAAKSLKDVVRLCNEAGDKIGKLGLDLASEMSKIDDQSIQALKQLSQEVKRLSQRQLRSPSQLSYQPIVYNPGAINYQASAIPELPQRRPLPRAMYDRGIANMNLPERPTFDLDEIDFEEIDRNVQFLKQYSESKFNEAMRKHEEEMERGLSIKGVSSSSEANEQRREFYIARAKALEALQYNQIMNENQYVRGKLENEFLKHQIKLKEYEGQLADYRLKREDYRLAREDERLEREQERKDYQAALQKRDEERKDFQARLLAREEERQGFLAQLQGREKDLQAQLLLREEGRKGAEFDRKEREKLMEDAKNRFLLEEQARELEREKLKGKFFADNANITLPIDYAMKTYAAASKPFEDEKRYITMANPGAQVIADRNQALALANQQAGLAAHQQLANRQLDLKQQELELLRPRKAGFLEQIGNNVINSFSNGISGRIDEAINGKPNGNGGRTGGFFNDTADWLDDMWKKRK